MIEFIMGICVGLLIYGVLRGDMDSTAKAPAWIKPTSKPLPPQSSKEVKEN